MVSSRRWSLWSVVAVVGVLTGGAGCNNNTPQGTGSEPTAATTQPVDQGAKNPTAAAQPAPEAAKDPAAAQPAQEPGDHKGRGFGRRPQGPDALLKMALKELTLTDAQKTTIQGAIDKLAPPKDFKPGDKAPFAALAAGVRAGKVDAAALTPKLSAAEHMEEREKASAAAIQTLHDTLTKEQRRALVDAALKKMEHGPGDHPRGDKAPGDKAPGDHARGDHGPGARGGSPIEHLLAGLDVTDAQRKSIDAALSANKPAPVDREAMKKQFEAMQAEMKTRLETFTADTFDAKAFVKRPEHAEGMNPKEHMDRMVKDLSAVVAVLDQGQREKLATKLEKGPGAMNPPAEPAEAPAQ
jgi:hypothetical protein